MADINSYYFDGSDAGATDPNGVWTNDANAFDNDPTPSTFANSNQAGSTSLNYLMAEGTNAPAGSDTITQVRARVYRSAGGPGAGNMNGAIYTDGLSELLGTPTADSFANPDWGAYVTLSTPSGGWTWAVLQALEIKIYITATGGSQLNAYKAEIEVTSQAPTMGYLKQNKLRPRIMSPGLAR